MDELQKNYQSELTVSQFLKALNTNLRRYRVLVSGEVTGRINRRGGVTYFSLHDQEEDAVLQCMGFNSALDALGIELEEGMAIKVGGFPEIWERSGGFSFKVFEILLTGEGTLKRQFQALLKKLEAEGMFDAKYKQTLPAFSTRIGLITAEGREAQTDFLTHLSRRGLSIEFYDVRVEGAQAVEQVVEAIQWFNEHRPELEVIVITRGGGSLESLQAFNNENVVRAIFASKIPIISAIGHEKDVTVADFVADVRASTPTHAGKIISESWERGATELQQQTQQLITSARERISQSRYSIETSLSQMQSSFEYRLADLQQSLLEHKKKLQLGNPELKFKQGYIVAYGPGGLIKSVDQVSVGDMIDMRFYDGCAKSEIRSTKPEKNSNE